MTNREYHANSGGIFRRSSLMGVIIIPATGHGNLLRRRMSRGLDTGAAGDGDRKLGRELLVLVLGSLASEPQLPRIASRAAGWLV
jgi:hypothetical protein